MGLKPYQIYENFKKNIVNKNETINLLVSILENFEDSTIRKESLEILNKLDVNDKFVFRVLENILVSDLDENLRSTAAQIIGTRFLKNSLIPFLWALQHESSYKCLIKILKSLKNITKENLASLLLFQMKNVKIDENHINLRQILAENKNELCSNVNLSEILINHLTINFLNKKFQNIIYEIENGLVVRIDFSKVDDHIIYWRKRDSFRDLSDIDGIGNLKNIIEIKFFPLKWVFNNEFTFETSIALLKSLERLNNNPAKNTLILEINKIDDHRFKSSIKEILKKKDQPIGGLSISKLTDILRNYLSITYLKKKFPSLKYTIYEGEIVGIHIEGESLIKFPEAINYFTLLQTLVLKECNLYTLPQSIGSLINLEVLNLEGNKLKIIPNSIDALLSLKTLNISKNQLQKLPDSILSLSSLQDLKLDFNKLNELPKSIGLLTSLKYLSVKGNKLQQIPTSIGRLKSLNSLNLSVNKIIELPQSIGLLYSLKCLNLDNNNLVKLPSSIISISTLKNLSLEGNKLETIPDSMKLLKSLKILKIGWNRIENLPNSIGFIALLKYLRVSNNKIQELPESLCSLSFLEYLDASSNRIKNIPKNMGYLKSLKILKLNDNLLKIPPDSTNSFSLLEKLNTYEKKIEELPVQNL